MKEKILDMAWENAVLEDGEHFLQWHVPCLISAYNHIVSLLNRVKQTLARGEYFL
jgi:hypothetical protein